jgi:alanyl-tRNA synthetase
MTNNFTANNFNTNNFTVSQVRSEFLGFFEKNSHSIIPSSSLVPQNDPTLMFTNAGMVQFKNVFSGAEVLKTAQNPKVTRATSSQKCVRAGGKHNDLDNVGYTARHHTFFEMLGNFSFSDYFKEEAIKLAWDLLTKTFQIPKEKLLATVYHTDDEAANLWKKIAGFSDDKIIRIKTNDNFWAMGDTGPCGPCSEIFYDHGSEIAGGPPGSPDEDGDRFIEIWNLVFMQFEKLSDGTQINLPNPCIDTGMGLERVSAVLQGKHNNYEVDLFANLIAASQQFSKNNSPEFLTSHRVIADHLRSTSFLLADGVSPSNEGRGYVLRRIMRRAMRHCHILGAKEPMMYKLVPALINEMGGQYSELGRAQDLIMQTLKTEEEKFKETLERGLKLLDAEGANLKAGDNLNGEIAFKLYDTYGFPLDLTQDILRAKNIGIDLKTFDIAMTEQREKARAAWTGSGEEATSKVWFDIQKNKGDTEFTGYNSLQNRGKIIAIINNGVEVNAAKQGEKVIILTDKTPFYAESGGQAGDKGFLESASASARIIDTKKQLGSLHLHIAEINAGELKIGDAVNLKVDGERRNKIRANHSATHIMHAALRQILGNHVTQKGSLVEADYFRFDFSHNQAVTDEEITQIEQLVNKIILQNTNAIIEESTPDEAIAAGAMALFGEKYGDKVRVLSMGSLAMGSLAIIDEGEKHFSVELCGGIHVNQTGDIGLFKITKEGAVASGIRRIEAVTGLKALEFVSGKEQILGNILGALKTNETEVEAKIKQLIEDKKSSEKQIADLKKKIALGASGGADEAKPEQIGEYNLLVKKLAEVSAKDLREVVDTYKKQIANGVIIILSEVEGKVAIGVGVDEKITGKISAVEIVKKLAEALGGKGGGGRPDFAQAGGTSLENEQAAINEVKKLLT